MIAVKNLGNLNESMVQEELLQAKTKMYCEKVTDKKLKTLLEEINKLSVANHKAMMTYIESHL